MATIKNARDIALQATTPRVVYPAATINYTWIKYGTSAEGAGLNDSPTGMTYIGLAFNKTTATESVVTTDYTWSLIQGATGAQGPSVIVTPNIQASFTATDGTLDASQANIIFTAATSGITSPTYVWAFSGFQTAPTNSGVATQTITSAQFGTSKSAIVTCTVSSLYTDKVTVVRLEKTTAAAGATVGATWDTNVTGKPVTPFLFWNFYNSLNSFTLTNISHTLNTGSITLTSTSGDPMFTTPVISLNGSIYTKVQIKIKRISGSGWDGGLFYATTTRGYAEGANKGRMVEPSWDGTYKIIEVDMAAITNGGTVAPDWVGSTITMLRFDFGNTASDVFEVASISIGNYDVGVQITPKNASTYIADLAVDTLQIAGNAVTIPISATGATNPYGNGAYIKVCEASVVFAQAGSLQAIASWGNGYASGVRDMDGFLQATKADGTIIGYGNTAHGGMSFLTAATSTMFCQTVPIGTVLVQLWWKAHTTVQLSYSDIIVLGAKR